MWNKRRLISAGLAAGIALIAWLGAFPAAVPDAVLMPPQSGVMLGTDLLGRPMTRVLLLATALTAADCLLVVALAGLLAFSLTTVSIACFGRWPDRLIVQAADVFRSFPSLVLALVFAALHWPVVLILALVVWIPVWRTARAELASHMARPYVLRARMSGLGLARTLLLIALPVAASSIRPAVFAALGEILVGLASLEFLGFGRGIGEPGLGTLASQVLYLGPAAWWVWVPPTVVISLAVATLAWLTHARPPRSAP